MNLLTGRERPPSSTGVKQYNTNRTSKPADRNLKAAIELVIITPNIERDTYDSANALMQSDLMTGSNKRSLVENGFDLV